MKSILPIHALNDNYIWMLVDQTAEVAFVVDPGDATPVIQILKQRQLKLAGILITHHHADHCGGIPALLDYAGNISVFGSCQSLNPHISNPVQEGSVITLIADQPTFQFRAIEIPGHTLDHTAYYGNNSLFCGDTLFCAGCGKVFEGTPEMMYASLCKLQQLDEATNIYCGHEYTLANLQFAKQVEPNNLNIINKISHAENMLQTARCTLPSTLKEEKLINPFLRCHIPSIIDAAERYAGKKLNNATEVFTILRSWKNHFTD